MAPLLSFKQTVPPDPKGIFTNTTSLGPNKNHNDRDDDDHLPRHHSTTVDGSGILHHLGC